jgi:hypothetical protein
MSEPATDPRLHALAGGVLQLAAVIDAPLWALPTFGYPTERSYPFVLREDGVWVWGVRSRGLDLERRSTDDPRELLYWIFEHVTRSIATASEVPSGDGRERTGEEWVRLQHALLGRLTPRWAARFRAEHPGWITGPDEP